MTHCTILQLADITRALTRISHEILESNRGGANLVVLGIPTRGVVLAQRIRGILESIEPGAGLADALDVTIYHDDLAKKPTRAPIPTVIPVGGIDDKAVALVDAALNALSALGRPRALRLAVFSDRGHREPPIRADFVGKNIPTSADERILMRRTEVDRSDEVTVV